MYILMIICSAFLFTEFIKLLTRSPSSEAKSTNQPINEPINQPTNQ
jgi:hypothetical protein